MKENRINFFKEDRRGHVRVSQLPPSAKEPAGQRGACKARDSDHWRGQLMRDENTIDSGSSSSKRIETHKDNFYSFDTL